MKGEKTTTTKRNQKYLTTYRQTADFSSETMESKEKRVTMLKEASCPPRNLYLNYSSKAKVSVVKLLILLKLIHSAIKISVIKKSIVVIKIPTGQL